VTVVPTITRNSCSTKRRNNLIHHLLLYLETIVCICLLVNLCVSIFIAYVTYTAIHGINNTHKCTHICDCGDTIFGCVSLWGRTDDHDVPIVCGNYMCVEFDCIINCNVYCGCCLLVLLLYFMCGALYFGVHFSSCFYIFLYALLLLINLM
jgi:hypothetical protein